MPHFSPPKDKQNHQNSTDYHQKAAVSQIRVLRLFGVGNVCYPEKADLIMQLCKTALASRYNAKKKGEIGIIDNKEYICAIIGSDIGRSPKYGTQQQCLSTSTL